MLTSCKNLHPRF